MEILPIKLLRDEDAFLFGSLNVCLGKLDRAGLPVVEGVVSAFQNGEPKVEIFTKGIKASGNAFYDPLLGDVSIDVKFGKLNPKDLKKIVEVVNLANKKLFIPYVYGWILDTDIKLSGIAPYTPTVTLTPYIPANVDSKFTPTVARSAVKVFLDLSTGLAVEKNLDGIFIDSERISDFDELTFKLASNLLGVDSLDFARHKKGLNNIHIVIPGVRTQNELMQIKRELATKKLMRKHSLEIWLELNIPENILNLEDYLIAGLDGVILNLDQLIAHLNGFDLKDEESSAYKKEVRGLLKFLEDPVKLLNKSQIPFIAFGSISLYPEVLDFLVEKGVHGIIVEGYEAHSMGDYLHQTEKRVILRRAI